MKRSVVFAVLGVVVCTCFGPARRVDAAGDEPTVYVIKQGDTLWGLSDKFMKDPFYWPSLWERNQAITNPHLILPGQKLKVYPDRIELEDEAGKKVIASKSSAAAATMPEQIPGKGELPAPEIAGERLFVVTGAEGFLLEDGLKPAGHIISTYQNREIVGEDDIVYADVGRIHGAKPGDRFSIFKRMGAISHPVTNFILGYKVIPLGALQISEVEGKVSKAIITRSYMEIGAGAFLLPYRERRREVALKAASKELAGYIVETQTGNKAIAAGDLAFIDLGRRQGVEVGNMLYVVRDVELNQKFIDVPVGKLPEELFGAIVIVEAGENVSTVLVIKSIDTIYRGDRVELKKSR